MRILVGCEESQVVTTAFRAKGHVAFSCDLMDTSGEHPEWHIKGNLIDLLDDNWDMLIAFPPCTFLTNCASPSLRPNGVLDIDRYNSGLAAKEFFLTLLNCPIPRICLENPIPGSIWNLPPASQLVQPFYFGYPYTKATYLWLVNLPILMATDIVVPVDSYHKVACKIHHKHRSISRSKTPVGMALAMADQWGSL